MRIRKVSSLARSIDLDYPTNKAIVIITLLFLSGVAGFQLVLGQGIYSALYSGLRAGAAVFFAWAFARELDPDNELSAFFAAFLGFTGFFFFPSSFLLVLFLGLLLIRLINRSTGLPAKTFDSFSVLLLSGWISLQENWIFGLFAGLTLILDSFLPEPQRQNRLFGVAALIVSGLALKIPEQGYTLPDMQTGLFLLAAILLFVPVVLSSRKVESRGDLTGIPLDPLRVKAAQLNALVIAGLLTVLKGVEGFESLMPLWAALLGVSLYRIHLLLKKII